MFLHPDTEFVAKSTTLNYPSVKSTEDFPCGSQICIWVVNARFSWQSNGLSASAINSAGPGDMTHWAYGIGHDGGPVLLPGFAIVTWPICSCGILATLAAASRQPYIIGGEEVQQAGKWYSICSLKLGTFHNCGASLIAPDWLITAVHCLVNFDA